jgi:lipoyl(octanoyl) transferase
MLDVELKISLQPVPYKEALEFMQTRVSDIIAGKANPLVWFLEHTSVYTAGTSANQNELLHTNRFEVFQTGRGGKYTYHGPGQRVVYLMLDIKQLHNGKPDLRKFVKQIEQWVIDTLACFKINGQTREGRVGIWVTSASGKESKIAALGIRVQKWVSFHGVAINIAPDLEHYSGIIPCGLGEEYGVTSVCNEIGSIHLNDFDQSLIENFSTVFGANLPIPQSH